MNPVWIVVIAFFVYWMVGFILFFLTRENETFAALWATGLVYILLYVICYPIRAMRTYTNQETYFKHNNVSRLQYFFGKRVHRKYGLSD